MARRTIVGYARVIKSGANKTGGVLMARIAILPRQGCDMVCRFANSTGGGKVTVVTTIATHRRNQRMSKSTGRRKRVRHHAVTCYAIRARGRRNVVRSFSDRTRTQKCSAVADIATLRCNE